MAFGQGLAAHQNSPLSKHGKNFKLIAIVGVGALALFLIIRARSSSTAATATDPTATTTDPNATTDTSGTPSTFADNGGQAAALGDAVTQGLGGVQTSLDNLTQADQTLAGQIAAGANPATAAPPDAGTPADSSASPLNITINTQGQKTNAGAHKNTASKTGQNNRRTTTASKHNANKPKTTAKTPGKPKTTQVANHGGGQKQHGAAKQTKHTKHH